MQAMRLPATFIIRLLWSVSLGLAMLSPARRCFSRISSAETPACSIGESGRARIVGSALPILHYTAMAAMSFIPAVLKADLLRNAIGTTPLLIAAITVIAVIVLLLVIVLSRADRLFLAAAICWKRSWRISPSVFISRIWRAGLCASARRWSGTFGFVDVSQLVGKTDSDFFSSEHASQALADEQEIIRTGRPILGKEEEETWEDGRRAWALTNKLPLKDRRGHIIGTMGISHDITQRKLAEIELARKAEELERTNAGLRAIGEGGGSGKPGEGRVSGQYEPRDPHTTEWRDRHDRAGSGDGADAGTARLSGNRSLFRGVAAEHHQRHSGLLKDRSRQGGTRSRGLRPARVPGNYPQDTGLRADEKGLELLCDVQPDVPDCFAATRVGCARSW